MTVGEKIQHYRKQIGYSQEELGQKLMVSRQTVSLWEMDKTLPTVDNLLRLKEIFGVSVDEILSAEQSAQADDLPCEQPIENYKFDYISSGASDVYKQQKTNMLIRCLIGAVAWAVLLLIGIHEKASPDFLILVGIMFAVYLVIGVTRYVKVKKTIAAYQNKLMSRAYYYEVFDTYFTVEITQDGECVSKGKVYLSELDRIYESGACLILQCGGGSYFLRKSDLDKQSVFFRHREKQTQKAALKKPSGWRGVVSVLLVVASICTIWMSAVALALIMQPYHAPNETMWVFFLFLPIPIASIVFGMYLKGKGNKYKKNVITGIIIAVMLCLYGSFSFIFANFYTHDETPLLRVESYLEIDIPTPFRINTMDWTAGEQSVQRGYVYSISNVYFDASAVQAWEEALEDDDRWTVSLPNDLVGITSSVVVVGAQDYFLVYNLQTGDINMLPAQDGIYRFIAVTYSAQSDTMTITEYELEYQK